MRSEWGRTPGPGEVVRFLEGPQPRRLELGRALGIFTEFIRGFRALHFVGPCVTVFGSARFKEDHAYYAMAREIGPGLAQLGFTVVTGGGPGIMEAANRGAREARGRSIGVTSSCRWSRRQTRTSIGGSRFATSSCARSCW